MSRRRSLPPRDQAVSSFSVSLQRLCDGTGALGATLVDNLGEAVDYAGYLDPYHLRVMAAEWRIVLEVAHDAKNLGLDMAQEFTVRSRNKSFVLVALEAGYALVLELPRGAFSFSRRALAEAVREIELEAGLPPSRITLAGERWAKLEVKTVPGNRRKPQEVWLEGSWRPVILLGHYAVAEGPRRLAGYRARLATGHEFALVREPLGNWFAGDL
jgi:hypothetical protein